MSYDLKTLKGIGEKTEKLFQKTGIYSIEQLLFSFPRDYDEYREPQPIGSLKVDRKEAVRGCIAYPVSIKNVKKLSVLTTKIQDPTGELVLTWFNMPFLRNTLKKGAYYIFRGKITRKMGKLTMDQPEIFTLGAYAEKEKKLLPVYPLTAGLTNKAVQKAVLQALDMNRTTSQEYFTDDFRKEHGLGELKTSLRGIHFPDNRQQLVSARKRFVFEEFYFFALALNRLKEKSQETKNHFEMKPVWITEEVLERLPYRLTKAQSNVWNEIERDLSSHNLMSRLVQGDVGSGKTILAFLAMIMTAENGYQSALMVPTEVLAAQHFEALTKLLEENDLMQYQPVLLTGSTTNKNKKEIYEKIHQGETKMIIGTHALIQEKVEYDDLALVITDEQHRFGVKQRDTFSQKGKNPHVLVMSATPIPRTLAIILYGDLDLSIIDELPANRLPIKNCVVDTGYREKAYRFIEREVFSHRQVYVVCPMVEPNEELDLENVIDYSKKLSTLFPPEIKVECLHGQMNSAQKNDIMERFAANEIQVLVSTTVIEVGINVPNATVMMIENAERFGLAQLHQLRGRIGRGAYQSYCIFVQCVDSEETRERLDILNHSNDGFFIASEDLRLRGPGDLFGIRQSGLMEFKIADIFQDSQILKEASEAAVQLLHIDPELELEEHQLQKKRLESYMNAGLSTTGI